MAAHWLRHPRHSGRRATAATVARTEYDTTFPDRFGSLADARAFCERLFTVYNHEHRHSGIGMHTPASVHLDTATEVQVRRQATVERAHAQNPERFTRRPQPPRLPEQAWINQLCGCQKRRTRHATC
jgi:hypothetical protein